MTCGVHERVGRDHAVSAMTLTHRAGRTAAMKLSWPSLRAVPARGLRLEKWRSSSLRQTTYGGASIQSALAPNDKLAFRSSAAV